MKKQLVLASLLIWSGSVLFAPYKPNKPSGTPTPTPTPAPVAGAAYNMSNLSTYAFPSSVVASAWQAVADYAATQAALGTPIKNGDTYKNVLGILNGSVASWTPATPASSSMMRMGRLGK